MEVRIDPHARERARERGVTPSQIEDVLLTGMPVVARPPRLAKVKTYVYDGTWKGRHYHHQRVKVIYVMEHGVAVTVTVVAFYGTWEG